MNGNLVANLRVVAWEITRGCNLRCAHCRASADSDQYPGELTTSQCFHLVDQIVEAGKPILILTGGEPLLRKDFLEIARYAIRQGLRVVMGTNGTLITGEIAARLKDIPLSRVGVSLDFPSAELQDRFRGLPGAFEAALFGIRNTHRAGVPVQINSTITRLNAPYLEQLVELALREKVVAFHPFMLVPTGRGKGLGPEELSPEQYERVLNWICDKQSELRDRLVFKPTDAPHYWRILRQRGMHSTGTCPHGHAPAAGGNGNGHAALNVQSRGCLAGVDFCFISHLGRVQGCGYLDVEAGNVKERSFADIWRESSVFNSLRGLDNLKGKCGACEFKRVCGGCRARAYESTGDYLEAEPYCIYHPASSPPNSEALSSKL